MKTVSSTFHRLLSNTLINSFERFLIGFLYSFLLFLFLNMCRHVLVIGRRVKLFSCMWLLMGRSLWLELFLRRRRFLRSASIWSLRRSLNSPTPWWEEVSTSLATKRPTSMNRWIPLLLRITLLLTQKKRRKWRSLQLHCQCKCWSCCFECCQGWLKAKGKSLKKWIVNQTRMMKALMRK